jgi:hypothetical protein
MEVISVCPLPVASLLWQPPRSALVLTAICKATFALRPVECALAEEQEYPNEDENHWNDDPGRSLYSPSDLAPFKPRAEVTLVGHAFAPREERLASFPVRLVAGDVDKSIEVFADRSFSQSGALTEGARVTKVPLRYERAAGGPDTTNPVGVRQGATDPYGAVHLPNLQPPSLHITRPTDFIDPVGFGPIAAGWPTRQSKLGRLRGQWSERMLSALPMPEEIDPAYFLAAPADQQLNSLRSNERLILENLHPTLPRLVTSLPGVEPRAFVERPGAAPQELPMTCDTLWIDTDRGICTLTWRAQLQLSRSEEAGRIVVAQASLGQKLRWSEIEHLVRPKAQPPAAPKVPSPAVAVPPDRRKLRRTQEPVSDSPTSPALPFARTTAEGAAAQAPSSSRISFPDTAPSAPPPGAPAGPVATSGDFETVTGVSPAFKPDASPYWLRPNVAATAPSAPAPPPPSSPLAAPPAATPPPLVPPVAAPPAATPPPLVSPVAAPPVATPPPLVRPGAAAGPSAASPWASGGPRMMERPSAEPPRTSLSPSLSGSPPVSPAPSPLFSPAKPPAPPPFSPAPSPASPSPSAVSSAAPSAAAASTAAAAASASAVTAAARTSPAPSAAASAAPPSAASKTPTRDHVELLWFDPAAVARVREAKCFRDVLAPKTTSWVKADAQKEPQEVRDRSDIVRALTRGQILDAQGMSQALEAAFDEDGLFTPPVALVSGELTFTFDELEALKATITVVSPFIGTDKKLRDTVTAATELIKAEWRAPGDVAEGFTSRVKEAFAQASRALTPSYLQSSVDKLLLEGRHYQRKTLLGETRVRAYFDVPGASAPMPLYLPDALAPRLPLFKQLRARAIVEIHLQEDQHEASSEALLAVALGRSVRDPRTSV